MLIYWQDTNYFNYTSMKSSKIMKRKRFPLLMKTSSVENVDFDLQGSQIQYFGPKKYESIDCFVLKSNWKKQSLFTMFDRAF